MTQNLNAQILYDKFSLENNTVNKTDLLKLHEETLNGYFKIATPTLEGVKVLDNSNLNNSKALNNSVDATQTGFNRVIDTLTAFSTKTINTLYYELGTDFKTGAQLTPEDFIPTSTSIIGSTPNWAKDILVWHNSISVPEIEESQINNGKGQVQDVGIDVTTTSIPVHTFGWRINYNYIDVQEANQASGGLYDYIGELEKARKKGRDLGMQKMRFLGLKNNSSAQGLLTLTQNVIDDTITIQKPLSEMTDAEFQTALKTMFALGISQTQYTIRQDRFAMDPLDHLKLGSMYLTAQTPTFAKTRLQALEEAFQLSAMNKEAKVLPLAYCDKDKNTDYLNKYRYVLYRHNEEDLFTKITVPYTTLTGAMTLTGLTMQTVAIERCTGVKVNRPNTIRYFTFG